MKKAIVPYGIILIFLLSFVLGCVPSPTPPPEETARQFMADQSEGLSENQDAMKTENDVTVGQLPVRYQKPAYMIGRPKVSGTDGTTGEFSLPVGADISTPAGPKPLGAILGQIVAMKNMGISYANDVDQSALITVNVRADQDFFNAIENILRPLDYYYELDGNTVIIKHKETIKYHIAMPFVNSTYATGVGGNVLGSTEGNQMNGTLSIDSAGNNFDIWTNIQTNLDKILEIWTEKTQQAAAGKAVTGANNKAADSTRETQASSQGAESGVSSEFTVIQRAAGKGYYTIDKPIGLISVTAPRNLLVKIETYIGNLKAELYRQVSIEAKIVEVTLNEDNRTGIDWSALLGPEDGLFNFTLDIGKMGNTLKSTTNIPGDPEWSLFTLDNKSFNLILDAMQSQGHVEVLSNPKISVMNGQPAMISVGENVTYVDSVESTVQSDTGTTTFTVNTSSVMSGLGLGVIATIMENDEIILSITPVTTNLTQPIEYRSFGGGNQVGLPVINLREMNTLVRVKNGEMLVVGGLIDQQSTYGNDKVSALGDIPFLGKLFRSDGTNSVKKELVVLLRPRIISL
jgi:general secretion pathway protein D/MSHA biogenesis protein MshL